MPDKVVHFELPADDLERAKRFYRDCFGWALDDFQGRYVMVQTVAVDETRRPTERGAINGGMLRRQPPIRAPVITIEVASIEAAARRVEAAGGKVVRARMPVGEAGFAAYFEDPEGNVVGLWETAAPRKP